MRKFGFLLALAGMATLAAPVSAQTYWQAGTGDWFDGANWDAGVPYSGGSAYIENGGTAQISTAGAQVGSWSEALFVGTQFGNGELQLQTGGDLSGPVVLAGDGGTGVFIQTGGVWYPGKELRTGIGYGRYELHGGTVADGGYFRLAGGTGGTMEMIQTGGTIYSRYDYRFELSSYAGDVTYTMSGGGLTYHTFYLGYVYGSGGTATWDITDNSVDINIAGASAAYPVGTLYFGSRSPVSRNVSRVFLSAVEGTVVKLVSANYVNRAPGWDGGDAQLAGLNNITMQIEGTYLYEGVMDPNTYEVAGQDIGPDRAGLTNNFALEGLTLGGGQGIADVVLMDAEDNWTAPAPPEGAAAVVAPDALYVQNFIIGAGSRLDLNGLNLYYYKGLIDPAATIVGTAIELPGIGGDANRDMAIDISDLGILAGNYGTLIGATWAMGDFNDDGAVDISDLGILAGNYGTSAAGVVPEPTTMLLLGLGGLGVLIRRRRRA